MCLKEARHLFKQAGLSWKEYGSGLTIHWRKQLFFSLWREANWEKCVLNYRVLEINLAAHSEGCEVESLEVDFDENSPFHYRRRESELESLASLVDTKRSRDTAKTKRLEARWTRTRDIDGDWSLSRNYAAFQSVVVS